MPREYPGYHDLDERLAEFRVEILTRMRRTDELAKLNQVERRNLAADPGAVVTVDSFLGTINTTEVSDVYFRVSHAATGECATERLPFPTERADHPILRQLRERFDLDEIAGDGADLERGIRLRDWIKSLFPHYIPYRMPAWNALTILDRASRGVERFICIHYSVALVQCCLALGMQARMINLHRGISDHYVIGDEAIADPPVDEHVVAEIWSSELDKWVMLDTDFDCHYELAGVAASAWDLHTAYVTGHTDKLTCHRGPDSHAFTALAETIADDSAFFAEELPSYYAHVSVLMRNNFLADPDGPVPIGHLLDDYTQPILWHAGSDLRLQPHLMGPVVVATPLTQQVGLLTDGNDRTGWASDDQATEHWVQVDLPAPVRFDRLGLQWPEYQGYYRTSRRLQVQVERPGQAGGWTTLAELTIDPEGPFTLHELPVTLAQRVRLLQPAGGGFGEHPNRLWLTQLELLRSDEGDV